MVALDKYLETEGVLIHILLNVDIYLRLVLCRPQHQELYLLQKVHTAQKENNKRHEWATAKHSTRRTNKVAPTAVSHFNVNKI
jgi:hypothetical protein